MKYELVDDILWIVLINLSSMYNMGYPEFSYAFATTGGVQTI